MEVVGTGVVDVGTLVVGVLVAVLEVGVAVAVGEGVPVWVGVGVPVGAVPLVQVTELPSAERTQTICDPVLWLVVGAGVGVDEPLPAVGGFAAPGLVAGAFGPPVSAMPRPGVLMVVAA